MNHTQNTQQYTYYENHDYSYHYVLYYVYDCYYYYTRRHALDSVPSLLWRHPDGRPGIIINSSSSSSSSSSSIGLSIIIIVICLCRACYGVTLMVAPARPVKILQRGVQWKQGIVICMTLCISLLHNTTPIHCTPLPLHPPVMNTLPARPGPARLIVGQSKYSESTD